MLSLLVVELLMIEDLITFRVSACRIRLACIIRWIMGGAIGKAESPKNSWVPETKLEAKMVEAMQRRAAKGSSLRSFNTIILKFPRIDECLRKCKSIFEQFGKCSL